MNPLQKIKEKLSLKKIQESITTKNPGGKELRFKIGATSGLYGVARSEELADIIMKLSYTLTQGAACLELASDVPHEVNYTQGKELRYIAERQGLDISLHGSLTVAMCIPERTEWEIAQHHMQLSIKSAVHAGAKYVDFHSCLREWLELFTYAGSKLEIVMCDHKGRFIKDLFADTDDPKHNQAAAKLRNWFIKDREEGGSVKNFIEELGSMIIGHDRANALFYKARDVAQNKFFEDKFKDRLSDKKEKAMEAAEEHINRENRDREFVRSQGRDAPPLTPEQEENIRNRYEEEFRRSLEIEIRNERMTGEESEELSKNTNIEFKKFMREEVEKHLQKGGDWFRVERAGTLEYAYRIMAHYLFFIKDKIWQDMIEMYKNEFEENPILKYNPEDDRWLEKALVELEEMSDSKRQLVITFKEFYYGVVGAKFLQGHLEELVNWIEGELPDVIKREVELTEPNPNKIEEQQKKLQKVLDELCVAIENPDSRNPEHGGRYLLWRPKQIYLAIKNIRESLKEKSRTHWDKIFMLVDFEHIATQGVDPYQELTEMRDNPLTKDFAKLVKTVHSGVPTPLHSHKPISAEDREIVYRLLWLLKESGLGSETLTYLIFERGGFKSPFAGSVRALKLFAKLMKDNVPPDQVPEAFYVVPKPQNVAREKVIIFEHAFDPIKGLLKLPEEEYTILGTGALKAGKRPEEWKKEELK